jgi:putative polyhydroxyalkanoate system protein
MFFSSALNPDLATIEIERRHHLGLAAARLAAEAIAADMDERFALDYEWESNTELAFRGAGVRGVLQLYDKTLFLNVHLGLMLLPVRQVLEQEIHEYIDQRLPCAAG